MLRAKLLTMGEQDCDWLCVESTGKPRDEIIESLRILALPDKEWIKFNRLMSSWRPGLEGKNVPLSSPSDVYTPANFKSILRTLANLRLAHYPVISMQSAEDTSIETMKRQMAFVVVEEEKRCIERFLKWVENTAEELISREVNENAFRIWEEVMPYAEIDAGDGEANEENEEEIDADQGLVEDEEMEG
mmetsp:Transcript_12172/g.19288  ORF Transcript_12172/g.19288 Transcript_12172/m.19288 type:complete len:189 (-) Transcript_12172:15-581(-)